MLAIEALVRCLLLLQLLVQQGCGSYALYIQNVVQDTRNKWFYHIFGVQKIRIFQITTCSVF